MRWKACDHRAREGVEIMSIVNILFVLQEVGILSHKTIGEYEQRKSWDIESDRRCGVLE